MEAIYLKIKIYETNFEVEKIRNQGLFFHNISDAIQVDREALEEIDETNYKQEIKKIEKKYNDKG